MPVALLKLWFGVAMVLAMPLAQPYAEGYLTHYAPQVAERVMDVRIRYFDELHPRDNYVPPCLAALNENHIDSYVLLRYGKDDYEICYVIDTAQAKHRAARQQHNYVVEVDYDTYWRMARRVFPDLEGEEWLPEPLRVTVYLLE